MCNNVSANISALLWLLSHSWYYSLLNEAGATEGPSIPDRPAGAMGVWTRRMLASFNNVTDISIIGIINT